MLGSAKVMAFVATADPVKAKDFYGGIVGLRLVSDDAFALVFDGNGTMLRVQKVDRVVPAHYTALGWEVRDIRTAVRELAGKGLSFVRIEGFGPDALGIWTAPDGTRVAWFKDPDGNILSLTEF